MLAAQIIAHDVPPGAPVPTVPPPSPPPAAPPEGDPPASDPPVTEPGQAPPVGDPPPGASVLGRIHARRLREVYRSSGWPCRDAVEVDLLAAGLLERVRSGLGHETLRVTDAGIAHIASALVVNRAAMSAHEALVEQVAREMTRAGRIAWRNLSLRARLAPLEAGGKPRWCIARPDVFSIRNTSVEAYAQPIVHEIKVRRADLLGDLKKPDKRAAYLDLGGECWYVLVNEGKRLIVARTAVHHARPRLPFPVWMALAKAQPVAGFDDDMQHDLADCDGLSAA